MARAPVFFFGRRQNCLRFLFFVSVCQRWSLLVNESDLLQGNLAKEHLRMDPELSAIAPTICVMTPQKASAYNYFEFGAWGHW